MRAIHQLLLAVALPGLLLAGGCTSTPEPVPDPPGTLITVKDLAAQLGLAVVEESATRARIRNDSNTVRIFGPPSRWIYVNARKIGPIEGMAVQDGSLHVPEAAVAWIRKELTPERGTWRSPLTPPAAPPPRPRPPPRPPVTPPPPEPKKDLAGFKLVLDPGHGGKDPGALGPGGYHEKAVNLSVARQVMALLASRGVAVTMTRSGDRFISLEGRAALSNRVKPLLFVSLHSDASKNRRARGFTVYVARKASSASLRVAGHLNAAMAATGLVSRGVQRADFRVLVKTACPAVLLEMGFISNASEAALLTSSAFQIKVARAVASGIGKALPTLR